MRLVSQSSDYLPPLAVEGLRVDAYLCPSRPVEFILNESSLFLFFCFGFCCLDSHFLFDLGFVIFCEYSILLLYYLGFYKCRMLKIEACPILGLWIIKTNLPFKTNKQKHNSNLVYINNKGVVHGGLGVYKD